MESHNSETVILGQKQPETQPNANGEATANPEGQQEQVNPNGQKETIDTKEKEDLSKEQPNGDQKKEDPKPKTDANKAKPETGENKNQEPKLKFSFNNEEEDLKKKPAEPSGQQKEETPSITANQVVDFLKNNGIDVDDLSQVSKKLELNEQVEAFRKFNEDTGRGIEDHYKLNQDWNKVSKENRIAEFLRLTNPHLSEEDIQNQLDIYSVSADDEVDMSPKELKKAKLEYSKMDAEALAYLTSKSKEYAIPKAKEQTYKQPTAEEIAESHKPYWDKRDKSLNELNNFSFNVDGIGEIVVPIDQNAKDEISKNTETLDSFVARWKDGDTMNTESLVKDTLWSIPSARQAMIQSIVEQVHLKTIDNFSKENRNVNLDKAPPTTQSTKKSSLIVEGEGSKVSGDQNFGTPLFKTK